jgi:hypothetical protein
VFVLAGRVCRGEGRMVRVSVVFKGETGSAGRWEVVLLSEEGRACGGVRLAVCYRVGPLTCGTRRRLDERGVGVCA